MGISRRIGAALVAMVVSITVAAGVLFAAPARAAEPLPAVGVQFHGMWSMYSDTQRASVLDQLAAAGARWVRIDMAWRAFEESGKGVVATWQVSRADTIVNMARARGLKVLVTVLDTPAWANGGKAKNVPPTDVAEYGRFMGWMADHFAGRVAAWEVWNEPNLDDFWLGEDPVKYAALVRAAYPSIKAADPAALVVAGAIAGNDDAWLARMYDAGARGSFDVLSTHPYQGPIDAQPEIPDTGQWWLMDHVGAVHDLMVARGDGAKPIWGTEFGWSAHANTGTEASWDRGVSEATQADYLVRAIKWFGDQHPYVTNVFWYNERNKVTGDVHEDNFGLLRNDLTPKPAYVALKALLTESNVLTATTVLPTTTTAAPSVSGGSGGSSTTSTTVKSTTSTTVKPRAIKPVKDRYAVTTVSGATAAFPGPAVSTTSAVAVGESVVGAASSAPTGRMWVATDRGAVRGVGTTPSFGDLGSKALNQRIVGVAARPTGDGYWLVARDGGVFSFGGASFLGSTGAMRLNQPIVGMAPTPSGRGYWLVASDGGIFAFGDAQFAGSTGAIRLNRPIVGMASTPSGRGYWLVASDGGVFSFGDARFFGSTGAMTLNQPIVGIAPTSTGSGYWFVARDGGVFSFGDAPFVGSATNLGAPVVALAAMR